MSLMTTQELAHRRNKEEGIAMGTSVLTSNSSIKLGCKDLPNPEKPLQQGLGMSPAELG